MSRRRIFALAFAILLVVSIVGPTIAMGQGGIITGEPRLSVDAPDSKLTPGTTTELELQISNDGRVGLGSPENRDVVTAARNVRVEVEGDGPIEIETSRQSIGTVTENEPRTVPIAVTVPEGADTGEFELDVELRYSHTSRIERGAGVMNDRSRTVTRSVDVEIADEPRFEITNVSTDAQIGDRGVMDVTLENIGTQNASDVRLGLETTSPRFAFGAGESESVRAGTLEPGEATIVSYDVAIDSEASVREFALDGTVRYTDPDGVDGVEDGLSAGVEPLAKQRFSLGDIESTLRVGEDGKLRGTVTNDGPNPAESVIVRFADESPNVVPIEDSVAVGTLDAGESASFELPIELTRGAEAIPKTFDMAVTYRNAENERRAFEDLDATAEIAEQRDEFELEIDDRTITAGTDRLIDVQVTNNLDEPVTDVEAKLFTDGPLGSDDDEGYVERLEPGETTSMTFRLSAAADATPRTYPIQMDFRYDDASGTSKVSDTYRTAIDVTEADEEDSPGLVVGAVVVVLVLLGGGLYWRRTRG